MLSNSFFRLLMAVRHEGDGLPMGGSLLPRNQQPGGWLLVENTDYASSVPVSEFGAAEHEHIQSVRMREFARMGIDHFYGRQLPAKLRAHGLGEVGNDGRVWIQEGGSPAARWLGLSLAHLRGR
jgi:hypothetical protein